MTRRPLPQSDLIWLGLLAAAVSLHLLLPDFRTDVPTDSYRVGVRGKKAFFLLADRLGYDVGRESGPLSAAASRYEGLEFDTVLCLLGPARQPTAAERAALLEFLDVGGAVLIAANGETPALAFPELGLSVVPLKTPPEKPVVRFEVGDGGPAPRWPVAAEIVGETLNAEDAQRLVTAGDHVQAAVTYYGDGMFVLVAGDTPFDNRTLTDPAAAVLAVRLLEAAAEGRPRVVIDESLNTSGTPKVVSLLLERPLRPLAVQLAVLAVLFGWRRSRRFGPLSPPSVAARSDVVAHADAFGALRYRSGDGRPALRAYLTWLSNRRRFHRGEPDPAAPTDDLWAKATAAADGPSLERGAAAGLIRQLAHRRADSHRRG